MGAPKGAPVSSPSTISSTALMYDESSEARKSTALPHLPARPNGQVEPWKRRSRKLLRIPLPWHWRAPRASRDMAKIGYLYLRNGMWDDAGLHLFDDWI